jgi:hypothetical protein
VLQVKKVEDVVYDLSLRNLVPRATSAPQEGLEMS